ncbi:hypothetical protein CWI36_0058p0010 [Hamiltosporidium magnivora]|uniref:Uncharacterized protein n=1 Tax=Hamiltosporidium magnivora TaxID=148818 RepID=A0A4Q9LLD0_9MICR|nr:hypothetical protein CWI36_0058p0010 [Hamiltosporidium magnivora]
MKSLFKYIFYVFVYIFAVASNETNSTLNYITDDKRDHPCKAIASHKTQSLEFNDFNSISESGSVMMLNHDLIDDLSTSSQTSFYQLADSEFPDIFSDFSNLDGFEDFQVFSLQDKSNSGEHTIANASLHPTDYVSSTFSGSPQSTSHKFTQKMLSSDNRVIKKNIPRPGGSKDRKKSQKGQRQIEKSIGSQSNFATRHKHKPVYAHKKTPSNTSMQKVSRKHVKINQHTSIENSHIDPVRLESVRQGNFNKELKFAELFKSRVIRWIEFEHEKIGCVNYNFFLSKIPDLYSEIDCGFGMGIIFNTIFEKSKNDLMHGNYTKIISEKIEQYNSTAIETEETLNEILFFANNLINFEEKCLPGLSSKEILSEQKITEIMKTIKDHKNLGVFYELLKFANYYYENLDNYVEKNYALHIYFLLSIISRQLKFFDGFKTLQYKNCLFPKRKCVKNPSLVDYANKFFVQKLFSRVLIGMKDGVPRASFYIVYLSLDLPSYAHHNNYFSNHRSFFKFYLRVLISSVLHEEFKPQNTTLNELISLAFDLFIVKPECKTKFINILRGLTNVKSIGSSLIKRNMKLIKEYCQKTIRGVSIQEITPWLENEKYSVSFNDIFVSEMNLSWYLMQNYANNNFEADNEADRWKSIDRTFPRFYCR